MKLRRKIFSLLFLVIVTACEARDVPPQSPAPVQSYQTSPSTPALTRIPFYQMTATALAIPTVPFVIEPTQTPAIPSANDSTVISPNGLYAIACKDAGLILFNRQTNTIISTFNNYFPSNCLSDIHWASDSSYALFGELYRWQTDDSQPESLNIHLDVDPNDYRCATTLPLYKWSSDEKYLALKKCGITVVVQPFEESSLTNPLLISNFDVEDFRWITARLLLVVYTKSLTVVHIPSGKAMAGISTSGGICGEQIPLMSPYGHWVVSDVPWCGGGERGPNQSVIGNLEDGSERTFSKSFDDRIEFAGWSQDGSILYLVSRPTAANALPDPRTPFGLLAMNPKTLQVQNIFEQARFVSFNKNFSWAYVVFPVKNKDDSLRLDGGMWEVGMSQLIGTQIMAKHLEEKFLEPVPYFTNQSFYSFTGEELGSSSNAAVRAVPAVWSHDNLRVATINSDHQLIVIALDGNVQTVGQLNDNQEWLYSKITWSDDDKSLNVDGVSWNVP